MEKRRASTRNFLFLFFLPFSVSSVPLWFTQKMNVFTAQQMRDFDAAATREYSLSPAVLMENAALRVVEFLEWKYAPLREKRIAILCGKGNNGGDGFAIARHLSACDCLVRVILACSPDELKGEARDNFLVLQKAASDDTVLQTLQIVSPQDISPFDEAPLDIALDCWFGTGFKGKLPDDTLKLLRAAKTVIAVDIPSGINADTGEADERALKCDFTVTFAAPKRGMFLQDGLEKCGEIWVGSIGTAPGQLVSTRTGAQVITREKARELLPQRKISAHKGTAGSVAICGGSFGMSGAPTLAARAALSAGTGLCSALLPQRVLAIFAAGCVEATSHPLPDDEDGSVLENAAPRALQLLEKSDALALGPGISRTDGALNFVRKVLLDSPLPVLVDADGLYALREIEKQIKARKAPLILTPHPGEMGELLNASTREVEADRFAAVTECARRYNAVVVLKGARTLVSTPGGEVFVNVTGNSGMATGGSGDALTGTIIGLLPQTGDALSAVLLGVRVHGAAGDIAYRTRGYGLTAGDIAENIALALLELRNETSEEGTPRLRPLR